MWIVAGLKISSKIITGFETMEMVLICKALEM
jgi:hypothetical protein